jgi:predicted DNA-binding protein
MLQTMKKTTISLYVDPEQLEQLREWSEETGAPVSEIIRRAIKTALDARPDARKGKKK